MSIYFKPLEQAETLLDTLKIYSNESNESPTCIPLEGSRGTYVSGNVSGEWTVENSPYLVQDNVVVPAGTRLTINPGVVVKLKPHWDWQRGALFTVHGKLAAVGTATDSVIFTKIDDDEGWWGSIFFEEANPGSKLEYCSISYGSGTQLGSFSSYAAVFGYKSTLTIRNCSFSHNIDGVSLREYSGSNKALIQNNVFAWNDKSGIANGILNTRIKNNILHHNGIGISCTDSAAIENNTIVNNETGLRLNGQSKPVVQNCIVWHNSTNVDDKNTDWSGEVQIRFSDIQGGWPGYGNIDLEPLFVDAASDNYQLQALSPCIDGGNPETDYSLEPAPNGSIINMGAYGNTSQAASSQQNSPEILVAYPMLDFGLVTTNQKKSLKIAVRNIGTANLHIQNLELTHSEFNAILSRNEITPNDSVEIAVEFVSPLNGTWLDTLWIFNDDPTEGKSFVVLKAQTSSALFGEISGVFTKEKSPYIIAADVTVPANKSLTLEPGTRVELMKGASFFIYGTLNCVGTEQDSIFITTHSDSEYWGGIYFGPESGNGQMKYTVVEYGQAHGEYLNQFFGTRTYMISCENSGPAFLHNLLRPIGVGGILVYDADTEISDNKILGGEFDGIRCCLSNSRILRNFVKGNEHNGIGLQGNEIPCTFNNILINNGNGISTSDVEAKIINNTILGSTNSGIQICGDLRLPLIKNNIIRGNERPFYLYGGAERAVIEMTYNDIEGGREGVGNIDAEPGFVNPAEDDYQLLPNSPCVDAGDLDPQYNDADGSRNDMGATGGPYINEDFVAAVPTLGISNDLLPTAFYLSQNYPNPFNASTRINYSVPEKSLVTLTIYDIRGQQISRLLSQEQEQGHCSVVWNGCDNSGKTVATGLYFMKMKAQNFVQIQKMILLR